MVQVHDAAQYHGQNPLRISATGKSTGIVLVWEETFFPAGSIIIFLDPRVGNKQKNSIGVGSSHFAGSDSCFCGYRYLTKLCNKNAYTLYKYHICLSYWYDFKLDFILFEINKVFLQFANSRLGATQH